MPILPSPFPEPHLPLLLVVLISLPFYVNSRAPHSERSILLNIKQQLRNPPSLRSWNDDSSSPCDWPEISCRDGTVAGVSLRDKNITREIPNALCDLKNLTQLDLANNHIHGGFPIFLYNCSKLQKLDLSHNYFVGSIPRDIDRLSSLRYIDLGDNIFNGDIPKAIGRLPELKTLSLYRNMLTGTFPPEIGNLSRLEVLGMAYNMFSPSRIPGEFGNLKKLRSLWITSTNLIGTIPEDIENCTNLEKLDLSKNNLRGTIPEGLFQLKNLRNLYLYQNCLTGEITAMVQALNLIKIDLSMNELIGSIPDDFGKLRKLEILNLSSNLLWGEIPASLARISTLKVVNLFNNSITGTLPSDFGIHSQLELFDISSNSLSGQLPRNLCYGGALLRLVIFNNELSGEVPKSLGNCSSLKTVGLHDNKFSGEVPPGLWSLINISILILNRNSFSGNLPTKLARNLSRLDISNNRFYGEIPAEIAKCANLVVFQASNNMLSGEIPQEMTSLSRLKSLMLDGNQLSGELPAEIISWASLTTLNLSGNMLSGQIPGALGFLPHLLYLDLSQNQLSGKIPSQVGHLKLHSLDLSTNHLSGGVPEAFESFGYESSFFNNLDLCSDAAVLNLPFCCGKVHRKKRFSTAQLAIIQLPIIAIPVVAVLLVFFIARKYQMKAQYRTPSRLKFTSFQRLGFTETTILSNLTRNNLIRSGGSGEVYRICTGRSGEYVAAKRIWSYKKLDDKLAKEFVAEVEILGKIRHSNIVKLLCCVYGEKSQLLVYEYLENQSLDQWIHKKRGGGSPLTTIHPTVLDWPTRLRIAIGAAQGLSYMHHDCSPPIIHRDVKSSNILLDSEFKAKIADFGLAKMLIGHGETQTISAVAGSIGYMAPEYAYTTKVNEKIDVYSFGVVLLELTTGREAREADEQLCLADWARQLNRERVPIEDALERDLREQTRYLEEMISTFKLGLICTSPMPSARPAMNEVVQILQRLSRATGSVEKEPCGVPAHDIAPLLESDAAKYISNYETNEGNDGLLGVDVRSC